MEIDPKRETRAPSAGDRNVAVRENRIDVVRFLLEHDCNPLDLWVDDDPIEIARQLWAETCTRRSPSAGP